MASTLRACVVAHVGPRGFALRCQAGEGGAAGSDTFSCFVTAVDAHVVRVCFAPGAPASAEPPPRRTPAVLPPAADAPLCAAFVVEVSPDGLAVTLRTPALAVTATLAPSLSLAWSRADDGTTFAQDRPSRAYALSRAPGTHGVCVHAARRGVDDAFYGLGDKSGPLNLAGRRLRTHMADALGRDPECVAASALQRGGADARASGSLGAYSVLPRAAHLGCSRLCARRLFPC